MGPRDWIAHCKRDVCLLTEAVHKDDVKPGYRCARCCRRACTVFFPKASVPAKIMALLGKSAPGMEPEPDPERKPIVGVIDKPEPTRDPISARMSTAEDPTEVLPMVPFDVELLEEGEEKDAEILEALLEHDEDEEAEPWPEEEDEPESE